MKAESDPPSLVDLRRRVEAMLPEPVLEVMHWVPGFTARFLPRSAHSLERALLPTCT